MATKAKFHKFSDTSRNLKRRLNHAKKRGVFDIAQKIVDDIKESVHPEPGSGRLYKIYRYDLGGKWHTASAAGEPPVQLTSPSALWESIGYEVSVSPETAVIVKIGVVLPYRPDHPDEVPIWLELGNSKMRPRPFIQPAIDRALVKGSEYRRIMWRRVVEAVY